MTSPGSLPSTDGRAARAVRTRDAVVEALLTLIEEGELRPTAREVSDRAGVSLRSVFQHFADLESLFAAAAERQTVRLWALFDQKPTATDFEGRLTQFTELRGEMLERVTPIRRAALLQEPFSPEMARRLQWARDIALDQVVSVFSEEIGPNPDKQTLAALRATTDWYTWETLRRHQGLSVKDAQRVMARMLRAILRKD
jgi:AcrR family transcriptional regulator